MYRIEHFPNIQKCKWGKRFYQFFSVFTQSRRSDKSGKYIFLKCCHHLKAKFILPYSCFLDFSNVHQNEIEEGHIFKCTLPIAFVMIALAWTSSNKSDLSALLFTGRFVWDKLQLNGLYCIGIFYSESTDSSYHS